MTTRDMQTEREAASDTGPAQAFGIVLDALVGTVAARLERKTAEWIDKLSAVVDRNVSSEAVVGLTDKGVDAVAGSGGAVQRGAAEGVKAHLHGRSPAWPAIRGVWEAGTPAVRAAVVTSGVAAVLLLLLSPALLLVYLLSWLVVAALYRARRTRHAQPPR
jgi:hypothetical protein